MQKGQYEEPVSIIIAARNEYQNLKKLLPQLYAQEHPDFEIIIVNDQSYDETYDFLKAESASNPRLRVVNVDNAPDHVNSKKFALTLGIKAAKNDLLLLTDADCLPNSNQWVSTMASHASDKQFVIGFSQYETKPGFLNYFIRFETLLTGIQYLSFAALGKPYMGVGRNLAYRKSLFLENKGFNGYMQVVGGDDDLFVNKHATNKNTAVVAGSEAETTSIPKTTWKSFFKQKLRHLSVGKHYKTGDKIILGSFSLSYLLSWLLLPILLIAGGELYLVIGSFLLRSLLFYITFLISTKKLNVTFNVWGLIFLELIYVFYYIFIAVRALFTKRVTWS
ncbi:glycosyltransferase [Fulvivirga aurantia]|uniref:glycosyltransferase n=1 Tax=Fulvivirga aurantia TaxID=2529383 RepID=UPI0031B63E43